MSVERGGISIPVGANLDPLKRDLKNAESFAGQKASKIANSLKKVVSGKAWDLGSFVSGLKISNREFNSFVKKAEAAKENYRELVDVAGSMESVIKNTNPFSDKPTQAYAELKKQAAELNAELEKLYEKENDLLEFDPTRSNIPASWEKLDTEMVAVINDLESVDQKMKALEESHQAYTISPAFTKLQTQLGEVKEKTEKARVEASAYDRTIKHMGRGQRLKGLFNGLKSGFTKIGSLFNVFRKHTAQARNSFGSFLGRLVGIGSVALLLRKAFSWASEGMGDLIKYDAETRNSVNQLRGALTSLKHALASAFAPILNAVAPIITKFIGMLTSAANAVASFISALLGKKYVVQANNVADGISGIGDSASGANDSAKELQRTLMGFDKINKLDSDSKGSGGSGGGGSSGGGAGGGFSLVPVSDTANEWADKFKESWEKADFYWLGETLANKINDALAKIPWDKINATLEKIAKSIGTFLNGFIENLDWSLLAKSISKGIEAAMNFVSTLIETINWQAIGKAIVDFITGIDWSGLFKSASRLAGNILGALAGVIQGVVDELKNKVSDYFAPFIEEAGGNVVKGIFDGIVNAIKNIPNWIKENILDPFLDGFKKAFGIASPSTVMAEQGRYIIAGLLEGLKEKVSSITDWFKDLPSRIREAMGNVGEKLEMAVDFMANLVGDTWKVVREKVSNVASYVAEQAGNVWDKITDMKGKTLSYFAEKAGVWWEKIDDMKGKTLSYFAEKAGVWWDRIADMKGKTLSYYAEKAGKVWDKLASTLKGKVKYYAEKAGKVWKSLTTTLKGKVQFAAEKIGNAWNKLTGKANGGIYKNGRWSPVQRYASGGSPNGGQMFIAREKGPELVGTLGGHTAVMNNDQIVASVSAGVARAIAGIRFKMLAPRLANASPQPGSTPKTEDLVDVRQLTLLLTQILSAINSIDPNVYLDGESIKNNTVRRINNHTRATGQLELII